MSIEDFHGPHPEPPHEGHTEIDWSAPMGRTVAVRVRAHTCHHEPTAYELCAAGGLAHLRRTERTNNSTRVSESPWMRTPEAQRLWENLLAGKAR